MKLSELLDKIQQVSIDKNLSKPYVVGGIPRDRLLGDLSHINDIDITTGNQDSKILGKEFALYMKDYNPLYKIMDDGHSSVFMGTVQIDFSNNFTIPGINKTNLENETFSRDFTCNSLLMSLDLKTVYDLTKRGVSDINNKILDTCLSPEITLKTDPKRIIRAIYLSSKLGFSLSNDLSSWIKENSFELKKVENEYKIKKLRKALSFNRENTLSLIKELNLMNYLPVI